MCHSLSCSSPTFPVQIPNPLLWPHIPGLLFLHPRADSSPWQQRDGEHPLLTGSPGTPTSPRCPTRPWKTPGITNSSICQRQNCRAGGKSLFLKDVLCSSTSQAKQGMSQSKVSIPQSQRSSPKFQLPELPVVLGFPWGHQVLGIPKIHTKENTGIANLSGGAMRRLQTLRRMVSLGAGTLPGWAHPHFPCREVVKAANSVC